MSCRLVFTLKFLNWPLGRGPKCLSTHLQFLAYLASPWTALIILSLSCFRCSPVVCCSFLVPSRSQSQLADPVLPLWGTVAGSAVVSQLSVPFFVAVPVVNKGTILQLLACARATLSVVVRSCIPRCSSWSALARMTS